MVVEEMLALPRRPKRNNNETPNITQRNRVIPLKQTTAVKHTPGPFSSQVASLEDTDGLPAAGATSAGDDGSAEADGLAGGAGVAGGASGGGGGGGSRAGWAKTEQVLGQRMERVATAWLEAIDQVRGAFLSLFALLRPCCMVLVLVLVVVRWLGCLLVLGFCTMYQGLEPGCGAGNDLTMKLPTSCSRS